MEHPSHHNPFLLPLHPPAALARTTTWLLLSPSTTWRQPSLQCQHLLRHLSSQFSYAQRALGIDSPRQPHDNPLLRLHRSPAALARVTTWLSSPPSTTWRPALLTRLASSPPTTAWRSPPTSGRSASPTPPRRLTRPSTSCCRSSLSSQGSSLRCTVTLAGGYGPTRTT